MGMPGPQRVGRCGDESKRATAKMSESPGVLIKDIAEALRVHPFRVSKWRTLACEGVLAGQAPKVDPESLSELKRLREVEQKFKRLQMEHDLLKKAIRFASELKAKSSPSSRQTGKPRQSK